MTTPPQLPELKKYEDWVDKLLMKGKYTNTDYGKIENPIEWTKYKAIESLVQRLYEEKYMEDLDFYENRLEVCKTISEAVAMTMFYFESLQTTRGEGEK